MSKQTRKKRGKKILANWKPCFSSQLFSRVIKTKQDLCIWNQDLTGKSVRKESSPGQHTGQYYVSFAYVMLTSTNGKAHAFRRVTYTLLIFAYLQPEQCNCDQTEDSASSRFCLCACTCVLAHVCAWTQSTKITEMQSWHTARAVGNVARWKTKADVFPMKMFLALHLFHPRCAFLYASGKVCNCFSEFHALVTGGWTNPWKIACSTQSLTHFEYCFYHTESAHTQLKGYETSWVKLSKLLTSPLIYER